MNLDRYNLDYDGWKALIDKWVIGQHAQRNRAIIRRHLLDGIDYESLAYEFGLSSRQIYNIVSKGVSKISKHI